MQTRKFLSLILIAGLILGSCEKSGPFDAGVPVPSEAVVGDIRLYEVMAYQRWDETTTVALDLSVAPVEVPPGGEVDLVFRQLEQVIFTTTVDLTGIPSGKCCPDCEEAPAGWTITCDAQCDGGSRSDGCNYHRKTSYTLAADPALPLTVEIVPSEYRQERDDPRGDNNEQTVTIIPLPDPSFAENPYDLVGRQHNQLLDQLRRQGNAGIVTPAAQQEAWFETATAVARDAYPADGYVFPKETFLYWMTGQESGLLADLEPLVFQPALERAELTVQTREGLTRLLTLLVEHPLINEADVTTLWKQITDLESTVLADPDAEENAPLLVACAVARYSLYYWAQPQLPNGPQLFGLREAFFADAFGGGMGAALGAIGGPWGAVIGGLAGAAVASVAFAP